MVVDSIGWSVNFLGLRKTSLRESLNIFQMGWDKLQELHFESFLPDQNMMHDNAEYFSFADEDSLVPEANLLYTSFNRRGIYPRHFGI